MIQPGTDYREIRHFQFCCGTGGMGLGFNRAHARVGLMEARMRCIGGVDVSPTAIKDFTRFTGVQGTVLDLFNEEQYRTFHRKAPPPGWRPATAADIRAAAHGENPHIVAMSAPCKGFSGLLNPEAAATPKYQALNALTKRCVDLMLEAWADDPPELIVFENVPRIMQRGRQLLDDIEHELDMADYSVAETTHDCGQIGDLAQHRKRFLLVARHRKKCPAFLYEPHKRSRLRGVGEVIGPLPLPDDPRGGPMHRCPRLHALTWKRLALIPAGGDWRSLEGMDFSRYRIVPARTWHGGVLGVTPWEAPASTVTGNARPVAGTFAVQDLRVTGPGGGKRQNNVYRIVEWSGPSCSVIGGMGPSSGGLAVGDPRGETVQHGGGKYRVTRMGEPAGAVIAESATGNGAFAVADHRTPEYVTERDGHVYGVTDWAKPAETVTGKAAPGSGRFSVADPRWGGGRDGVVGWEEPAGTVKGESHPSNGVFSVADPRVDARGNAYGVAPWDEPSGTVIGVRAPGQGASSVADPRALPNMGQHAKMRVEPWDEPTHTVTGSDRVGSGALSVQDVRVGSKSVDGDFVSSGHYGVVRWEEPTLAVTGSACHDNGAFSVADPRDLSDDVKPDPYPIIIALDGTWHRPFTGLELAVIQDYPAEALMQEPMTGSETTRREHIGNSVPPGTAAAIGSELAKTLLLAWSGTTFRLESTPIWVQPLAIALSIDRPTLQGVA